MVGLLLFGSWGCDGVITSEECIAILVIDCDEDAYSVRTACDFFCIQSSISSSMQNQTEKSKRKKNCSEVCANSLSELRTFQRGDLLVQPAHITTQKRKTSHSNLNYNAGERR